MYRKSKIETFITICKKRQPTGIWSMAQKTQTGALCQPRGVGCGGWWEGGSEGKGYIYTLVADSCWGLTENKIL